MGSGEPVLTLIEQFLLHDNRALLRTTLELAHLSRHTDAVGAQMQSSEKRQLHTVDNLMLAHTVNTNALPSF